MLVELFSAEPSRLADLGNSLSHVKFHSAPASLLALHPAPPCFARRSSSAKVSLVPPPPPSTTLLKHLPHDIPNPDLLQHSQIDEMSNKFKESRMIRLPLRPPQRLLQRLQNRALRLLLASPLFRRRVPDESFRETRCEGSDRGVFEGAVEDVGDEDGSGGFFGGWFVGIGAGEEGEELLGCFFDAGGREIVEDGGFDVVGGVFGGRGCES